MRQIKNIVKFIYIIILLISLSTVAYSTGIGSIDAECAGFGYDNGIAKWEYNGDWSPEGDPAGTFVNGTNTEAYFDSGTTSGEVVAVVVKAGSTVHYVIEESSGYINQSSPAISHITFCENYPPLPKCVSNNTEAYIYDFGAQDFIISNSGYDDSILGPFSFYLPAGFYNVTLVSHDGYVGRENSVQNNEQWIVTLLDGTKVVVSSSEISDLPDGVDFVTITEKVDESLFVSQATNKILAVHAYYFNDESPNSVRPACAIFEPIPPVVDPKGSITVCKIIIDEDYNVVDGSEHPNTLFEIMLSSIGFTSFYTPLDLDTIILDVSNEDDAKCVTYKQLDFGNYYYDEEVISGGDGYWFDPLYNEQYNVEIHDLDDFFEYNENSNSNGVIKLTEDTPDRTLVVLNQYGTEKRCMLLLTKSDDPDPVRPGDELRYYLTLENIGTADCTGTGVKLYDYFDLFTYYLFAIPTPNTVLSNMLMWNFGTITPGEIETVNLTMNVSLDTECNDTIVNKAKFWSTQTNYGDYIIEETSVVCDPYCGDGIINNNEECDYGDANGDVCTPSYGDSCNWCSELCLPKTEYGPYCGDGVRQSDYEQCDGLDGVPPDYTCLSDCTLEYVPYCGDGILNQPSEDCDGLDGVGPNQECTTECTLTDLPYCGDGIWQPALEECEGIFGVGPHQECSAQCTIIDLNYCGDGIVQTPNDDGFDEQCDGTDGVPPDYTCLSDCTLEYVPYCGDGILNQPTEECDGQDGTPPNYICLPDCTLEYQPYCGDGILNQQSEQCDGTDGTPPGATCTADCLLEEVPCLNISYIDPYYTNFSSQWIDTASRVELLINQEFSECVDATHYYIPVPVEDEYCLSTCDDWQSSSQEGYLYSDPFPLSEELCYIIEYYTDFGNHSSLVEWDCVFVDKTPPEITKVVGIPKEPMSNASRILGSTFYPLLDLTSDYCDTQQDACLKVSSDTPINVSCEDIGDYPSGVADICFSVGLDGDDATEYYCDIYDGNLTEGLCCMGAKPFELYFLEDSWHEFNLYCEDNVGKNSNHTEYFKVEGTAFEIQLNKKWNLISVPVLLFDNDIETVFAGHEENVEAVWTYDNGNWSVYTPDGNPSNDNLHIMLPGWGYWVLAKNEDLITVGGNLLNPATLPPTKYITAGWNLIGYYGTEDLDGYYGPYENGGSIMCEFSSIMPTFWDYGTASIYSYWELFNPPNPWISLDLNGIMDPGAGYWIFAYEDGQYVPSTICGFIA